jgi:DNA-binding transcriptional LysR family regulator
MREEPLCIDTIRQYRAVAVGDTSRNFKPLTFGLQSGQAVLTVPNLQAKVKAQLAGLGCGWLPWNLIEQEVANGELLVKKNRRQYPPEQPVLCLATGQPRQGTGLVDPTPGHGTT